MRTSPLFGQIRQYLDALGAREIVTFDNGFNFVLSDGAGWNRKFRLFTQPGGEWLVYYGKARRRVDADWKVLLDWCNRPNEDHSERLDDSEGVDPVWEE